MFRLTALSQTEGDVSVGVLHALAKIKRVVHLSVHHVEQAAWLPHFGVKVGIEEALRRSGLAFTILRPNNFYQNDYWYKDVMLSAGIYPQPLGDVGLSRVDVRDIAEVAAIARTSPSTRGRSTTSSAGCAHRQIDAQSGGVHREDHYVRRCTISTPGSSSRCASSRLGRVRLPVDVCVLSGKRTQGIGRASTG